MSGPFDPLSSDAFDSLFGGFTEKPAGGPDTDKAWRQHLPECRRLGLELMDLAAEGYALAERWGRIAKARAEAQR